MQPRDGASAGLPGWVPPAVRHYIEHVEGGAPIRVLARRSEVHASTVLRQVRQLESRRDDPLVDAGLKRLSRCFGADISEENEMTHHDRHGPRPETAGGEAEALRVLRRMAEPGAVLAVASEMPMAAVVREDEDGTAQRLARLDRSL
ncbi:helix-turn-helix domain-containing protein, partial [Limimaricola sp. ASW11-118]|nr:helix-turn-helix domain-containing protein [Limimaricola litoreus]